MFLTTCTVPQLQSFNSTLQRLPTFRSCSWQMDANWESSGRTMQESVPPKGLQRCRGEVAVQQYITWLVYACAQGLAATLGRDRQVQAVSPHRDAHQALLCLQIATNSLQELPLVLQRREGFGLSQMFKVAHPFRQSAGGAAVCKTQKLQGVGFRLSNNLIMCSSS